MGADGALGQPLDERGERVHAPMIVTYRPV
jgi:hypothetical protein